MPDIYALAWKMLSKHIAKSRRQSITKADLTKYQLLALEQAVDNCDLLVGTDLVADPGVYHGQQEKA